MSKIEILRKIQEKKNGGLILSDKVDANTIAEVIKDKRHKFVNQSISSKVEEMKIDNDEYIVEPFIPIKERFLIVISGRGGEGKSTLGSVFTKQYNRLYPTNKVFIISQKDYKDDVNLSMLDITQLNAKEAFELDIKTFSNSLILFDDNDTIIKEVNPFLQKLVEIGRIYEISLIFITHVHSRRNVSMIYSEPDIYITFNSSLDNNRMLDNLKIKKNTIELLKSMTNAYIAFNMNFDTIITDKIIFKNNI